MYTLSRVVVKPHGPLWKKKWYNDEKIKWYKDKIRNKAIQKWKKIKRYKDKQTNKQTQKANENEEKDVTAAQKDVNDDSYDDGLYSTYAVIEDDHFSEDEDWNHVEEDKDSDLDIQSVAERFFFLLFFPFFSFLFFFLSFFFFFFLTFISNAKYPKKGYWGCSTTSTTCSVGEIIFLNVLRTFMFSSTASPVFASISTKKHT